VVDIDVLDSVTERGGPDPLGCLPNGFEVVVDRVPDRVRIHEVVAVVEDDAHADDIAPGDVGGLLLGGVGEVRGGLTDDGKLPDDCVEPKWVVTAYADVVEAALVGPNGIGRTDDVIEPVP
jgi:hypothetical protein